MIFSPQKWFCTCCGKEMFSSPCIAMGKKYKVCGDDCHNEMAWRDTLSILGKEYYPQKGTKDDKAAEESKVPERPVG